MVQRWTVWLATMGIVAWLLGALATPARAQPPACRSDWQLPDTLLKDHTFFEHDGYHYFAAISLQPDLPPESSFAYARTPDFCTWENLGFILGLGPDGAADEQRIWAPHVFVEDGVYHMFYTGVNDNFAQSILLATTTTPEDPQSWQRHGVVFVPDHEGMVYAGPHAWSDARDAMVLKHGNTYYLYYTGLDVTGGIVGLAMAPAPEGPWHDLGAVYRTDSPGMAESPFVLEHAGVYYLYYNLVASGPRGGVWWHWAPSPFGPWQPGGRELLGWAHDFARVGDTWLASYVRGNKKAIGVTPLLWNTNVSPPAPQVGPRAYLPLVGASPTP